MKQNNDSFLPRHKPLLLSKTELLYKELQAMSVEELQKMYHCSDKIAVQNQERFQKMELRNADSPAVFSYHGLAFQHLSADTMTQEALDYLEEHLRILSGFYGVLRPFDGVVPYRLEMQNVLPEIGDLYTFWGSLLYEAMDDHLIINAASGEYASAIQPYLTAEDRMITIVFGELKNGKVITKGTKAKMKRGDLVWWMAENHISSPEEIKQYQDGYVFDEERSDETHFLFLEKEKG